MLEKLRCPWAASQSSLHLFPIGRTGLTNEALCRAQEKFCRAESDAAAHLGESFSTAGATALECYNPHARHAPRDAPKRFPKFSPKRGYLSPPKECYTEDWSPGRERSRFDTATKADGLTRQTSPAASRAERYAAEACPKIAWASAWRKGGKKLCHAASCARW